MPLPSTPAAGFDQPFELLSACHGRVTRSLDLLDRLVDHVRRGGDVGQAVDAACDVLRYFDIAAPAHHEDEERHVFPRLAALGDAALLAVVERLRADHRAFGDLWQSLRPLLEQIAERRFTAQQLDALGAAARAFRDLHTGHLDAEDRLAFPAARVCTGASDLAAMGAEMARRRGVR